MVLTGLASTAWAQNLAHPNPCLDYVFPAGGRQGQTVTIELGGPTSGYYNTADQIHIEGPPGIRVDAVKGLDLARVEAKLTITADAPPGPRWLRVVGAANGMSNARPFFVGKLPEVLEQEKNDTSATAQEVTTPVVVNGRLQANLDVDWYAFQAKAGQRIVAAVLAHGMDSLNLGSGGLIRRFLDTRLQLLDEQGKIVATAEDTLGLDPVIDFTVPRDGRYLVGLQSLEYLGSTSAVYRLTLGEVPYPLQVFPPGGQRGQDVEVELSGPNIPPGTRQKVSIPADGSYPLHLMQMDHAAAAGPGLALVRGDHAEALEIEPNADRTQAMPLTLPVTVNARFSQSGDEDWYRVTLRKGEGILVHTLAQRHLRLPVDTLLEIYDAAGRRLAENDDGRLFIFQCIHDFQPGDSWLPFTAAQDGDYFLRLTDQAGSEGPQALYRLTVEPLQPDFLLYQWPDSVPIWGPGTTASMVIEVQVWGGLNSGVQLRVEGLPAGWTGSVSQVPAPIFPPPTGMKALLTITAPANAPLGTVVPFRVVGTAEQDGRRIEREAQYLTLYGSSHNDRMHLRASRGAWAVVARPMDASLETSVKEITARQGDTVHIPVTIRRPENSKGPFGLVINGQTPAASCAWTAPISQPAEQTAFNFPLELGKVKNSERPPGTYAIVVARSWASDLRAGRPGPCTSIILLHVLPAAVPPEKK